MKVFDILEEGRYSDDYDRYDAAQDAAQDDYDKWFDDVLQDEYVTILDVIDSQLGDDHPVSQALERAVDDLEGVYVNKSIVKKFIETAKRNVQKALKLYAENEDELRDNPDMQDEFAGRESKRSDPYAHRGLSRSDFA